MYCFPPPSPYSRYRRRGHKKIESTHSLNLPTPDKPGKNNANKVVNKPLSKPSFFRLFSSGPGPGPSQKDRGDVEKAALSAHTESGGTKWFSSSKKNPEIQASSTVFIWRLIYLLIYYFLFTILESHLIIAFFKKLYLARNYVFSRFFYSVGYLD